MPISIVHVGICHSLSMDFKRGGHHLLQERGDQPTQQQQQQQQQQHHRSWLKLSQISNHDKILYAKGTKPKMTSLYSNLFAKLMVGIRKTSQANS